MLAAVPYVYVCHHLNAHMAEVSYIEIKHPNAALSCAQASIANTVNTN